MTSEQEKPIEVDRLADAVEDGTCECVFDFDSDDGKVIPVEINGQPISENTGRLVKAEVERRLLAEGIPDEAEGKEF